MRVLCLGHVVYDFMFQMTDYPLENSKNKINKVIGCGGGQASNAAYLLGYWNIETYIAGVVGNDIYGVRIKKEFEKVNVNTSYLQRKGNTTLSYIIVNSQNGSRTPLTYHVDDTKMDDVNININPDIILIDGYEYDMALKILDQNPQAISVIDAEKNNDQVISLCKKVDYVVCSLTFLEKYSKIRIIDDKSLKQAYQKAKKEFKNLIVTLEQRGCIYNDEIIPSIKVDPVDSTGAGDIFHGAFVYGLAHSWSMEKILRFSNIAGALSVTRLGSRNSCFGIEEVKKVYNEFK